MNNCFGCLTVADPKERPFILLESNNLKVALRPQANGWFGRCAVIFKDHEYNVANMLNMRINGDKKYTELNQEMQDICTVLTKLFKIRYGASHINYAELGNLGDSHRHQHIIPRYSTPPEVGGKKYPDPQYNNGKFMPLNLAQEELKEKMSPKELTAVKTHLLHELAELANTDELTRNLMNIHKVALVDPEDKTRDLNLMSQIKKEKG